MTIPQGKSAVMIIDLAFMEFCRTHFTFEYDLGGDWDALLWSAPFRHDGMRP